ncbi:putative DNA methylase [Rhodococcus rhodochrous J3]|uniref:DNA methylase n=1 Tax=Rhodococcus rhodochrous J3 TaxID=903528 RepID=A0ABY1MKZ3_RHORH|nr:putative DNA methylase [Rhodococcus rhodochrous J3]
MERERLHGLIERLVVWENVGDQKLLAEAHAEIVKSAPDGRPPAILDPFAGGGTIPLEAQRLGLEAHASDLNPVAVLINKALVEFPPKFKDQPPIFPGLADSQIRDWKGTEGLAADVRAYGQWIRDEAEKKIGHLYPKADGKRVIAWIWARTVTCPNPACGIEMPLVRSWWLGKKKGKEAYVVPQVVPDKAARGGRRVRFEIGHDPAEAPRPDSDGTVARTTATCVACKASVPLRYVREEGQSGRLGTVLMAVVAEGNRRREYLTPTREHRQAADLSLPDSVPVGSLPPHGLQPANPQTIRIYGFNEWSDLFTNRQLVALTTFSDLVMATHAKVIADSGTRDYADAVATYLAMTVSRQADLGNALCRWEPNAECPRQLFARQAIPMVWDFAEGNPLGDSSGSWKVLLDGAQRAFGGVAFSTGLTAAGAIQQANASERSLANLVISTDPPYYDNIGYSDLSDFFYVWLRRSLRDVHPGLLSTMLVPKAEELVANPHRHNGKAGAKEFFENGFREVFAHARSAADCDYPITVYYAFKQSESDEMGDASTGWETLLEGMIRSGWEITSTWPLRTETSSRMVAHNANALASSIVLSLRPREDDAPTTDRRGFISALEAELPDALRKLQQGQVAPVDLPQAAIGPGMAVFSRYSAVLEPAGTRMTVRSALARINEILDQVLNEQEGDFDASSRFAIAWYRQHGYEVGAFGDANNLANARNTTVDAMDRDGILTSRAGKVQLIRPNDLSWDYAPVEDLHISNWEALHHVIKVLERDGIVPAGDFLQDALSRPDGAVDPDLVKELAHLLFRIAEGNGWTKDALSFNTLVTSWPEILEVARNVQKPAAEQSAFDFDEGDD